MLDRHRDTTSNLPLHNRVAVVTGASRGIGRAIAVELAAQGAVVALNYRRNRSAAQSALEAVVARGSDRSRLYEADVSQPDKVYQLISQVISEHGRIDVLVNNAGIERSGLLHKLSDSDWHDVLNTNLSAVFYLCRAALPVMLEQKCGHIINVASASSVVAQRGAANYVASKHGLIGLTKALALETARSGVLVNAVAPGITDTDMVGSLTKEQREKLLRMVPLGRMGTADEVARLVGWLAMNGGYSTGNVFHCSGGVAMG